jgi:hypothetical protein
MKINEAPMEDVEDNKTKIDERELHKPITLFEVQQEEWTKVSKKKMSNPSQWTSTYMTLHHNSNLY